MKELRHENLIHLIDVKEKAIYRDADGYSTECFALVLEYAAAG